MKRKRASEIFAAVDPNLKVIDGGTRCRRHRKLSARAMLDWQKLGGTKCPRCGGETQRLIEGKCPQCYRAMVGIQEAGVEDRAERRHVQRLFREGRVSVRDLGEGRY